MNAIRLYRIANSAYKRKLPIFPTIVKYMIFLLYNCSIPYQCSIGKGSFFAHGGIGVVLHPNTKIGKNVLIGQNVTIGGSFESTVPTIGDNVWIGPGARILGGITIGQNSIVGANAVLRKNVPKNSVVGGVPAKIIRTIEAGEIDILKGQIM